MLSEPTLRPGELPRLVRGELADLASEIPGLGNSRYDGLVLGRQGVRELDGGQEKLSDAPFFFR